MRTNWWFPLLPFMLMTAFGGQESDFEFTINGSEAAITRYHGNGGSVVIPNKLGDTPVTRISNLAFYNGTAITSLIIPDTVKYIDSMAFSLCSGLTDLAFGNGLLVVGESAFSGCSGLRALSFPKSLTAIGRFGFSGCSGLTSLIIPTNMVYISDRAFANCTSLTNFQVTAPNPAYVSVDGVLLNNDKSALLAYPTGKQGPYAVPDSVTVIREGAFESASGITGVTLPDHLSTIADTAFYGCSNLNALRIPNSVTSIGSYAFYGCVGLTNITLPQNLTTLADGTFQECSRLTSVAIPDTLTQIGNYAFAYCMRFTDLTIGNKVHTVGNYAFIACAGLTNLDIGSGVTSLGTGAFRGCPGLVSFKVAPSNPSFSSQDGVLFNRSQSYLLEYPGGRSGDYMVPESVLSIQENAFSYRPGPARVRLGRQVRSIGSQCFEGCTRLTKFDVDPLNPSFASIDGVLFGGGRALLLTYPSGRKGAYTTPSTLVSIASGAFTDCTGLTTVSIPSASQVATRSFVACTNLTVVTIGSVAILGDAAFNFCTSLTTIRFGGSPPSSGSSDFLAAGSPFVTVFYPSGSPGWGPVFRGHPTAAWITLPDYNDWAVSTGLAAHFPGAFGEAQDPDHDQLTNKEEWLAGTDPTQKASTLAMELAARPSDLVESDRTPVQADKSPVYFRSVPGRYYGVQRATNLAGSWELKATRVASPNTTQTRLILEKPDLPSQTFYRVVLLP